MAAFLYYGPDLHAAGLPEIRAAGIEYAFDASPATVRVQSGPDGRGGIVLADEARLQRDLRYLAEGQEWRRVPTAPAWIGRYRDDPLPGPADLRRESRFLAGHEIPLGPRGELWTVPVVRGVDEQEDQLVPYCAVPRAIGWNEEGRRVFRGVLPDYAELWQAACQWAEVMFAAQVDAAERVARLERAQRDEIALVGLRANYRVSFAEADWLGLLTEQSEFAICNGLIDWPSWENHLKKKRESAG